MRPSMAMSSDDLVLTWLGVRAPFMAEKKCMFPLKLASLPQLLRPRYVFVKVTLEGATRRRLAWPTRTPLTHLKLIRGLFCSE